MPVHHRKPASGAVPLASSLAGFLPPFPGLNLGRRFRPLQRARRAPFSPEAPAGPYRLPKGLCEALARLLEPFRNREAAFSLATFLARHWSSRDRLGLAFPIDRRALTDHAKLGLSEARIRGAIATLERIGFLDRPLSVKGSVYRATEDGLRRKAILFRFGAFFVPLFQSANRAGAMKRQIVEKVRDPRPILKSPKDRIPSRIPVLKGDVAKASEGKVEPDLSSPLEQALAKLRASIIAG